MSAWTDSLRAASFRGIPFEVEGGSIAGGRRVGVHETPGSDLAVTEDLGRRTREISMEVYVIGDDAVAQSIALLEALEADGPGLLVHPLYGEIRVNVRQYQQTDSWDNGAVVMFSLTCIEAGELTFVSLDTGSALDDAIAAVDAASGASFEALFSAASFAGFVLDSAIDAVGGVLDAIEAVAAAPFAAIAAASDIVADVAGLRDRVEDLIEVPGDLVDALSSLMTQIGDLFGLRRLAAGAGDDYTAPTPASDSNVQRAVNLYELDRLNTRLALSAACAYLRDADLTVYDDAIADRDSIAALIAAEEETTDSAVCEALRSLRVALVEDVTARVAALPRVTTYTPSSVVPAAVIAWSIYGDAERADEVVDRNRIVHPLFVPAEALSVLTQ